MTAIYDVSLDDELSPFTSLKGSRTTWSILFFYSRLDSELKKKRKRRKRKKIRANGELGGLFVMSRKHSCCCVLTGRTDLSLNLGFPDESLWLLIYAFYYWRVYSVCVEFFFFTATSRPQFRAIIYKSLCVCEGGWESCSSLVCPSVGIFWRCPTRSPLLFFSKPRYLFFFFFSPLHCMFSLSSSLEMDRNIRPSAAVTLRPWPSFHPRPTSQ